MKRLQAIRCTDRDPQQCSNERRDIKAYVSLISKKLCLNRQCSDSGILTTFLMSCLAAPESSRYAILEDPAVKEVVSSLQAAKEISPIRSEGFSRKMAWWLRRCERSEIINLALARLTPLFPRIQAQNEASPGVVLGILKWKIYRLFELVAHRSLYLFSWRGRVHRERKDLWWGFHSFQ